MIAHAILSEHFCISVNGGYRFPLSKSACVTKSERAVAAIRKVSSGIVRIPAHIAASAIPGNM